MTSSRRRATSPVARSLALSLALNIGWAGTASSAPATGLITAQQVAGTLGQGEGLRDGAAQRARLNALLSRADLSAALTERGVSAEQARARVAALTDAEVMQLLDRVDADPAGASELLGTVVLVFAILVFTDILGYTHVFPFIKPAR